MTDESNRTVYLALALSVDATTIRLQESICSRFDLVPRTELHVTIGYLGEVTPEQVFLLGDELRSLAPRDLDSLHILGTGGAIKLGSEMKLISDPDDPDWPGSPRVLWWAIRPTESMIEFRNTFIGVAAGLNLDLTSLRPLFSPHVTLGSNGPGGGQQWELWDVHAVEKPASLGTSMAPSIAAVSKLHLSSVPMSGESLFIVQDYL